MLFRSVAEKETDEETDAAEEDVVTAEGDDADLAPADAGDQDLQSEKMRIPWWLLLLILLLILAAVVWFFAAGRKKEEESEEDE